jgi:hypothetical protein
MKNPPRWCCPYKPINLPIQPPTIDPAIPSRIVIIKPPGSFPGMSNFAITPTTRPKNIHPIMPCIFLLTSFVAGHYGESRRSSAGTLTSLPCMDLRARAPHIPSQSTNSGISKVTAPPERPARGAPSDGLSHRQIAIPQPNSRYIAGDRRLLVVIAVLSLFLADLSICVRGFSYGYKFNRND